MNAFGGSNTLTLVLIFLFGVIVKSARDTFWKNITFVNETKSNMLLGTFLDALVFGLMFLALGFIASKIKGYLRKKK